jgi:hypothetical protein
MKKLLLILLFPLLLSANYNVSLSGLKIGTAKINFKEQYIVAHPTNGMAKMLLKNRDFIFYEGLKPSLKKVKYKKDKNGLISILKESLTKPTYYHKNITSTKEVLLTCNINCKYNLKENGIIKRKGAIILNQDNSLKKITEEISGVIMEEIK